MTILSAFLGAFAPAPEPEPASRVGIQKNTVKQSLHKTLENSIPEITYSF